MSVNKSKNIKLHPLQTVLYGALMGMADTIPGVSGATIAYIVGFYETFLKTIKSFDLQMASLFFQGKIKAAFQRPMWHIVLPLIVGIFLGFLFFAKIVNLPRLVTVYPTPIYALFFGLILASLPKLFKGHPASSSNIIMMIIAIIGALLMTYLLPQNLNTTSLFLFICGFLALSAMMLPGISGSYILLILGQYSVVITAIAELRIIFLLPFIFGACCSLIFLSRILSYLMESFPHKMTYIICGLLMGSLWKIWPFQERIYTAIGDKQKLIATHPSLPTDFNGEFIWAIICFLFGLFAMVILEKLQNKPT